MAEGSLYKRCGCKDDTGRRLGARCPQLHRPGGGWSPTHGTWGYQLELPVPPGHRRDQLRRGGYNTRDDAIAARNHARGLLDLAGGDAVVAADIAALLRAHRAGQPLPSRDTIARRVRAGLPATSGQTLGDYLTTWLAGRRTLQDTTARAYDYHIRNHLIPHLGHIPLDQLRIAHIAAMFTAIEDRNQRIRDARASNDPNIRASVTGLRTNSPANMQRIRATLRKALNDAIRRDRIIEFNPAAHVELPTAQRPKARVWTRQTIATWHKTGVRPYPVMVWAPTQAGAFLDYAETHDPDLYPLFALILHRGLRRGEACGLPDHLVDLDQGYAIIAQQITTYGHRPVLKKVKSTAGDRILALDATTIAILRAYLARKAAWRLTAGPTWPDNGLFFVRPSGRAWHPGTLTSRFNTLVTDSGQPPIRLHDLRHCAATYLRAAGADLKEVQETLGHSTIAITADTYTSVLPELQRAAAEAAANLIPRQRRRSGA